MTKAYKSEEYGLDDPEVLRQATELSPELFAALAIAKKVEPAAFPLKTDKAIEGALAAAANEGSDFRVPGVVITPTAARDHFPNEFLPVVNRADLVRKIYLAIVINHTASARREIAKVDRSTLRDRISHPMPKELE